MSTPAEKYVTHWDGNGPPQWITRLENGQYQSYHYVKEAADLNTAHLNELVKLRAAYAEMAAKVMSLRASEHALQSENAALRHSEESLASTVRGLEFELEKANKQIDGLFAELASTGADELREYRAENHQISQKASKLCYDLIARERELEKANAALDLLNTHCMSADPIMGRSTYRWTIEHDEPDIRVAIDAARTKKGGAS